LRTRPGADLKTLQDLLGHSSIVITADTYTSVLPLAQRRCAEATAKLVLAAAHRTQEKIRKKAAATGRPTAGRPVLRLPPVPGPARSRRSTRRTPAECYQR